MAEQRWEMNLQQCCPQPPPLHGLTDGKKLRQRTLSHSCCIAGNTSTDLWQRLFADGYRADVCVYTNDDVIPAHASILGMASSVLKNMLKRARRLEPGYLHSWRSSPRRSHLPPLPLHVMEEMNQYALHMLVLSHVFMIPSLKQVCIQQLESGLLTTENVVDALQLARLCDAPRLSLLCQRLIIKRFMEVSASGGWKAMRQSDPKLEKELLESVIEADSKEERMRRSEERKIYLQLHEAMEALVHICGDGCRTIGPRDKVLQQNAERCSFPACKGLEALVRHFAGCKNRVLGGCSHCKRMWQLLELHSRLCAQEDGCKVPLCRHFKEKVKYQSKKDELKWKLLVSKVIEAKNSPDAQLQPSSAIVCS